MRTHNLKISLLIVAYACEPCKGSEPGVGWGWVKTLAPNYNLTVITRENNRTSIEAECANNQTLSSVKFVYVDLPYYLRFWKKGQRGVNLYYTLWQIYTFFRIRKEIILSDIDIIHLITFGNFRLPTFITFFNKPCVIGPLGGGDTVPKKLLNALSIKSRTYEYLRLISIAISKLNPIVSRTLKQADIVIARTGETAKYIKKIRKKEMLIFPESAIDISDIPVKSSYSNDEIVFVSVGSLLEFKGYHLSLKAFKKVADKKNNCKYILIGDGPQFKRLSSLISNLGLNDKVVLKGKLSRNEIFKINQQADIFLHPSLHDACPWAVLEAMAAGLPVICLDLGGPALQVTEETGFKIHANTPEQVIRDMAKAMQTLAENPELRRKMGEAGRRRVQEYFSWNNKKRFASKVYKNIIINKFAEEIKI